METKSISCILVIKTNQKEPVIHTKVIGSIIVNEKQASNNGLQIIHEHHIVWHGQTGIFYVMGALSMDVSSLRVSIHIERQNKRKERLKLDLFDYAHIARITTRLSEESDFNFGDLESDFLTLTELLENHRNELLSAYYVKTTREPRTSRLSLEKEKEVKAKLEQSDLLDYINDKLGSIGIAGEEANRLLLFFLASSYKHTPLHAVIESSSGSGKSHLINTIAGCFPENDVISLSRVTSKSLYHYKGDTLQNKLILIQDFDGLDEEALFAFRELQSYGKLTTSMTGKDILGNHSAKLHTVEAHFASIGATTKELYTDNGGRSILLKMDESKEQTKKVLAYQSPSEAIVKKHQQELKNMTAMLKPANVINPYIDKICIPHHIPMARRINTQLKDFIEQITYLHQYQRKTDEQGRLITTKEDVETGIKLFLPCLWLKADELDASTRTFYERLKTHYGEQTTEKMQSEFSQREIRHTLGIPKTSLQRYIKSLMELEYLEIVGGSAHSGFKYAIQYTDNTKDKQDALFQGLFNNISA